MVVWASGVWRSALLELLGPSRQGLLAGWKEALELAKAKVQEATTLASQVDTERARAEAAEEVTRTVPEENSDAKPSGHLGTGHLGTWCAWEDVRAAWDGEPPAGPVAQPAA